MILAAGDAYWTLEEFRNERWVDVFGYQTPRDMTDDASQWLVTGPVSKRLEQVSAAAIYQCRAGLRK